MDKELSFEAFLKGNAKPIENIEMVVSNRFVDKETGKPVPWILRLLTAKENNQLRKRFTKRIKNKFGKSEEIFDSEKYQQEFILNSIIYPDLTLTKIQESYGATGAWDLLEKMLTASELADLQIKLLDVADKESEEESLNNLIEDAKN